MTERRRSVHTERQRRVQAGRKKPVQITQRRSVQADRQRSVQTGRQRQALYNRDTQLRRIQGSGRGSEGRDYYDYNLLAAVILLTCFGLVMLYSTSAYEASVNYNGNDAFYFTKQAAISAASFGLLLLFSQLDYHIFARFSKPIYYI